MEESFGNTPRTVRCARAVQTGQRQADAVLNRHLGSIRGALSTRRLHHRNSYRRWCHHHNLLDFLDDLLFNFFLHYHRLDHCLLDLLLNHDGLHHRLTSDLDLFLHHDGLHDGFAGHLYFFLHYDSLHDGLTGDLHLFFDYDGLDHRLARHRFLDYYRLHHRFARNLHLFLHHNGLNHRFSAATSDHENRGNRDKRSHKRNLRPIFQVSNIDPH